VIYATKPIVSGDNMDFMNNYAFKPFSGCDFGLHMSISNDMSHREILKLKHSSTFKSLIDHHGFALFEGTGIEDAFDDLNSRQVSVKGLYRSLNWHVDRKGILLLYYPKGTFRPCDFIISRKKQVIQAMIEIFSSSFKLETGVQKKLESILGSVDLDSHLDVSVAIAEIAILNTHPDYERVTTTLLTKELELLNHQAAQIPITREKCQIIFCKDTVEGDICHGRICSESSFLDEKDHTVDYFFLKDGDVSKYI
jgi:hypothetical protein